MRSHALGVLLVHGRDLTLVLRVLTTGRAHCLVPARGKVRVGVARVLDPRGNYGKDDTWDGLRH